MQENQNFEKHACQNMVAMEMLNLLDQDMSYQIVARQILGQAAEFGEVCFNIKKSLTFKVSAKN